MAILNVPGFAPIGYREVLGSNTFSFLGNVPKGTCTFYVDWNRRYDFAVAMLGQSIIKNINTDKPFIARIKPQPFPEFVKPDFTPVLHATSIESIEGVAPRGQAQGEPDPSQYYNQAKIKFNYESLTYSIQDPEEEKVRDPDIAPPVGGVLTNLSINVSTYVTKIVQPSMEVLRLPYGYMSWVEGLKQGATVLCGGGPGNTNITGVFKMKPQSEITYVWHRIPALPKKGWLIANDDDIDGGLGEEIIGAVFTHLGCVNEYEFDGYAPETLLLKAVEVKPYRWIDGQRYYDYIYHMSHFNPVQELTPGLTINPMSARTAIGHNHFIRLQPPKVSGASNIYIEPWYCRISHDGTDDGRPLFPRRKFKDLFIPYNKPYMKSVYSS